LSEYLQQTSSHPKIMYAMRPNNFFVLFADLSLDIPSHLAVRQKPKDSDAVCKLSGKAQSFVSPWLSQALLRLYTCSIILFFQVVSVLNNQFFPHMVFIVKERNKAKWKNKNFFPPQMKTSIFLLCVDCLHSFTDVEELEESELYMCSNCKKRQRSTKKFWIRRLPNVSCTTLQFDGHCCLGCHCSVRRKIS
jgi:hypothetical protein